MVETLRLELGGIVCDVRLPNPGWHAALVPRYADFLSESDPAWQVELRHDPTLPNDLIGSIEHTPTRTTFRIATYAGVIDLSARKAWISAVDEARAPSALDRVLSYICMQVLPREHRSLLLHAVGLEIRGNGYVFFGHSGAGKTTLAGLAQPPAVVLTDENVFVGCSAGAPQLISTPFWGHSTPPALIHRLRQVVPLRALFTLRHAPDFAVTPLTPADAVLALLTTEKVATERVASAEAWFKVAEQLVSQVPVYRLEYPPTPEVWTFLEQRGVIL